MLALVLVGDFNLLDVYWKYNTVERKQPRRLLKCIEDNCHTAIQRELNRLEKWADKIFMKLSKEKFKVLHLRRNNPGYQDMLGSTLVESRMAEKWVLVDIS